MGKSQIKFEQSYNEVRKKVKAGVGSEAGGGKEATMWAVVEATAAIFDGIMGATLGGPIGGMFASTVRMYSDIISDGTNEPSAVPNPWFIWNGHDDNPTWYTREYMKNRNAKGVFGGALAVAGMGVSFVSAVDIAGIAQHGNAVGSTGAHMVKFQAIAKSYKESRTIANWLGVIMKMKAMKLGIRTAGLVGSCVPVPAVGAVTGVLAAAGKLGAKLTMTKVCLATAADLHWRAYQELALTRTFGGTGPGLRIVRELFTRRGATRVFGKYNVEQIIREPNGWIAINDKLTLI